MLHVLAALWLLAQAAPTPTREFRLVREWRIDGHDEDLVAVGWLGVRRDGLLVATQPTDNLIRFYDVSGNAVGRFGRKGSGPREFQWAPHGGFIGDTLWIVDYQLRRVTLLSPGLKLLRTLPVPEVRAPPAEAHKFPGVFVLSAPRIDWIVAVDRRGYIRKTLGINLFTQSSNSVKVAPNVTAGVPFSWSPREAFSPRGDFIVSASADPVARSRTFQLTVHPASGGQPITRAHAYTPIEIPAARIDSAMNRMIGRFALGQNRAVINEFKRRIPRFYNPVAELFVGNDGRIWIGMPPGGDTREWLVLDRAGSLVARMKTPAKLVLKNASSTNVWGIETDEFDVQSIVRFRIVPK